MMARVAARLEVLDPGFARTRHGARTACATVLSGLTLAVVTSVFGVAEPLRITLFGAGACFFGALLVTDLRRSDRAHTFGWASVVAAAAIVVTVELSRTAVWAAAAFLVSQMFLSYALRSWSLRAGNLAVIGALITFLAGAGHITSDRIGWFVLASTVGFAWVTASEYLILPDDPVRLLKRSVDVFCRSAGDAVASVVDMLATAYDGSAPDRPAKALRRSLDRVMRCRIAIESQLSVALLPDFGQHDVEQLRVALYCAERGTEEMINRANDPRWIDTAPRRHRGIHHEHPAGPRERAEGQEHRRGSVGRGRTRTPVPPRPPSRRDEHCTERRRCTAPSVGDRSGSPDDSRGCRTRRPVNFAGNSIGDCIARIPRRC